MRAVFIDGEIDASSFRFSELPFRCFRNKSLLRIASILDLRNIDEEFGELIQF